MAGKSNGRIKVVLFCGGRGSQHLIRELLRRPNIELTLLVNAYDDGLSTGALRALIPGMLGPSDFRKNFSNLLGLYSPHQHALQKLIEYRMPEGFAENGRQALEAFARRSDLSQMPASWCETFASVEPAKKTIIVHYVERFLRLLDEKNASPDFTDYSFGNIIFAGAFLDNGNNFNATSAAIGRLVDSEAGLLNVSAGESLTLVALKENGEILSREAEVVGPQSPARIETIYFLNEPIDAATLAELAPKSMDEKRAWLDTHAKLPTLSAEVAEAIGQADVILFGPGTQHSSLFPSYLMAGEAIRKAPARVKAMVVNLHHDYDIQGYDADVLVSRALHYLGSPGNDGAITHVLFSPPGSGRDDVVDLPAGAVDAEGRLRGAKLVSSQFYNPNKADVHNGAAVVDQLLALQRTGDARPGIDLFIDLHKRSLLAENLVQEFLEIDWVKRFGHAELKLNRVAAPASAPDGIVIERTDYDSMSADMDALTEWLSHGSSEYLVTLTGDGEYRMSDIRRAIDFLEGSIFAAVYGSRSQSRQQLRASLGNAYGDNPLLRLLSFAGAWSVSLAFLLRLGRVFSDPMTGFRIYRRSGLPVDVQQKLLAARHGPPTRITRLLVHEGIEICEVPVSYKTFRSFTDFRWRLSRGFRNLAGLFL